MAFEAASALNSESDGERVFTGVESDRTKVTTTMSVQGKVNTLTRIVQAKWLGTDCGGIKPLGPPNAPRN